jgi:hypothetical protein
MALGRLPLVKALYLRTTADGTLPPQRLQTGGPEALDPGKPLTRYGNPSDTACPDRALPRSALLRAAAACCRRVLGEPPAPRASRDHRRGGATGVGRRKCRLFCLSVHTTRNRPIRASGAIWPQVSRSWTISSMAMSSTPLPAVPKVGTNGRSPANVAKTELSAPSEITPTLTPHPSNPRARSSAALWIASPSVVTLPVLVHTFLHFTMVCGNFLGNFYNVSCALTAIRPPRHAIAVRMGNLDKTLIKF